MPVKKVTPDFDQETSKYFTFGSQIFHVRDKFKVGRFLKELSRDPSTAIEIVLTEESYEQFLDTEMDIETDFPNFLELMSNAIAGKSLGN